MGLRKRDHFFRSDSDIKNGLAFWAPETKKQAHAVWQWYNSCAARVLRGKQPLCRNLDETFVFVFQVRWEGKHRLTEAKGASF